MSTTPALDQLMGAYFHEDWALESEDEWAVLEHFVRDSPDLARRLPDEISLVLTECPDEQSLEHRVVRELGGVYVADPRDGGYRGWLTHIASQVRSQSAGST